MGRRKNPHTKPWGSFSDGLRLALDCQHVVAMRMARIAGGGRIARREANRMIAEKTIAAATAQFAAAMAFPFGGFPAAASEVGKTYQRAIRANRTRLSRH